MCIRYIDYFPSLSLQQAIIDDVRAVGLQCPSVTEGDIIQRLSILHSLADQLGCEQGKCSKKKPGVVMYIGLNESVAVTDANSDHRVHCDTVGGQMAGGRGKK